MFILSFTDAAAQFVPHIIAETKNVHILQNIDIVFI